MAARIASGLAILAAASVVRAADCGGQATSTFDNGQFEDGYWTLRQALCNLGQHPNKALCDDPKSCEFPMVVDSRHRVTLKRTSSGSSDYSACFNATENIIEQCIRGQHKAEGTYNYNSVTYSYSVEDINLPPVFVPAKGDGDAPPTGGNTSPAGRKHPSGSPKCAKDVNLLVDKFKVTDGKAHDTSKGILYRMRETLCNNKCENPPGFAARSVKATKKGANGCEISIAMSGDIEAFAVRDSASQGVQWQDCWDSFSNITEKCVNFNPNTDGWVNGPDNGQFYQLGYRPLNNNNKGSLHSAFGQDDALPQWCGDTKPTCDKCSGGVNNHCTTGDFTGCACDSVFPTQPQKPAVTNCPTAVAAGVITCCGWSQDTQATCANIFDGCGAKVDLHALCQTSISKDQFVGSPCLTNSADAPLVKDSPPDELSKCLNDKFSLDAKFKYI